MSKISIRGYGNKIEKHTTQIETGTYFTGKLGGYSGLFVKSYCGIVYLQNPQKTWEPSSIGVVVLDYQEVDPTITYKETR